MKTLLKNGTIVNASGSRRADVLICGEKIKLIGEHLESENAKVVDCTGKLLFPGFIDAHTHFDLDVCNTTTADDFYTGGRAAFRGGTTTVIDFACPNKGESLQYGLELWHRKAAGRTACDYGFHMTIDDWNESIRAEIPKMLEQGVTSFKMYLTYPAMMIGDGEMFQALQELKKYGGITGVHCENAGVIDALIAEHKAAGKLGPESPTQLPPGLCWRPRRWAGCCKWPGGGRARGPRPHHLRRRPQGGRGCPSPRPESLCRDLPAVSAAGGAPLQPAGL